ncbi:MAG TPA: hypothetical protein VLB47_10925, partial [Solirubrobacteraceae bacterium]|nr:hypothetical protein [Solirubrobacteraceae bacterium]
MTAAVLALPAAALTTLAAAALALELRRRAELAAHAAHELRGRVGALLRRANQRRGLGRLR